MAKVLAQYLLHQHRQLIEPLAHVGHAACQEHPRRQRHRVHRSTDNTRGILVKCEHAQIIAPEKAN